MKEQKRLVKWIHKHKRQLIIAGISITALIMLILGIKNRGTIKALWISLKRAVASNTEEISEKMAKIVEETPPMPIYETLNVLTSDAEMFPFEVRRHIRNLPRGWHASPEKIAEAQKMNIILLDGQTWVDSYTKGGIAA